MKIGSGPVNSPTVWEGNGNRSKEEHYDKRNHASEKEIRHSLYYYPYGRLLKTSAASRTPRRRCNMRRNIPTGQISMIVL